MANKPTLSKSLQLELYANTTTLGASARRETGLIMNVPAYLQDPGVAKHQPFFGIDPEFEVQWEPGITDGPTSARFAVVDYDADTEQLATMAQWDSKQRCFCLPSGEPVTGDYTSAQFHQVNVWAHLQRALAFFEGAEGLGRPIPYGFDGNRLIVVPHAGYGKNAFYDRTSKSLQFYYFDIDGIEGEQRRRIHTCLSADIVAHEFGHAVLDGVRPFFQESVLVETSAFHEFMGDFTAILLALDNEPFRHALIESSGGDLSTDTALNKIAEEFGEAVGDTPYLRSGLNELTMDTVSENVGHHELSQVLTGALFDILKAAIAHYRRRRGNDSDKQVFARATKRVRRLFVHALDFLPPVDATFHDFALALLRADEIVNPVDPHRFRPAIAKAFHDRGILSNREKELASTPAYTYRPLRLSVFHHVKRFSGSMAAAYRFLNDNRAVFQIPPHQDFIIADLYNSQKTARAGRRLPRQITISYIWREDIRLIGSEFAPYENELTSMLCGGTLVFDNESALEHWAFKPGTELTTDDQWHQQGQSRRDAFLIDLKNRIQTGQVGDAVGIGIGLLPTHMPPVSVSRENGQLRFHLSPHIGLFEDDHDHYEGFQWEISS